MKNRVIGIAVLLVVGFIVFVCLSGFGMMLAVILLTMHPGAIILGTIVSSFMVLFHLLTKENS